MIDDNTTLIPIKDIMEGIHLSRKNAENYLADAKFLYDKKIFRSTIPLATISTEESKKGYELFVRFVEGKDITNNDWKNLTNHAYKFKHDFDVARKFVERLSEEEHMNIYEQFDKIGLHLERKTKEELIKAREQDREISLHLQTLRELCFYGDWNKNNSWKSLSNLSEEEQDALSFFVLIIAETHLWNLHDAIEYLENSLKSKKELYPLISSYTKYPEIRKPLEYNSKHESDELEKKKKENRVKITKGEQILRKFILR